MRWFIEVSTVGSGETDTEYCVEAKQWQAALQQARKLRGEAGPLSAFSIELLDSGYRAVDKKQNLKYVVKKAPNDAPLNDGKNGVTNSVAEAHASEAGGAEHTSEESSEESSEPQASADPAAPAHQVASSPRASGPPPRPRLVSSRPPEDAATTPPEKSKTKSSPAAAGKKAPQKVAELLAAAAQRASARPNASPAATPSGRVGSAATSNTPRTAAGGGAANAPILAKGHEASSKAQRSSMASSPALALEPDPHKEPDAEAEAKLDPAAPRGGNETTPEPGSASMPSAEELPEFEVIRSRGEEPSKETPITYREVALGVHPGVTRKATMALLWARYRSVLNEIAESPKGKFVQIAVFDHVFSKKPIRPPLATLMWKDWRGEPALAFPGFSGDSIPPPPPLEEPAPGSLRPISMIPVDETTGSRPPSHDARSESAEAQARTEKGPPPNGEIIPSAEEQDASSAQAGPDAIAEQAGSRAPTADASAQPSVTPVERASGGPRGAGVAVEEIVPLNNRKPTTDPPGSTKRERGHSSDDLIGDLFEKMHELHFMADVVGGSEFVLRVVKQTLPSAFVLIHVFDINTKNFIVVRQYGTSEKVLMFQTPDSDPQLRKVMRSSRTANLAAPDRDEQAGVSRWKAGGVEVGPLLAGPVKQGGRYLGLIEIGNPPGTKPFADIAANALDYICEQFAQFLTNRPIVLDADIILK